jgi:uncharacterized protein (DUF4415 family)
MTDPLKAPRAPGYVQNPHYTQEDWDEVSDTPESTEEELAQARPFAEAFPELAKSIARRGPQKALTKVAISIRLAPDVLRLEGDGSGLAIAGQRAAAEGVATTAREAGSAPREPQDRGAAPGVATANLRLKATNCDRLAPP